MIVQGNTGGGIALLIVGVGILSQIDNFLRPFVVGSRIDLHPMAIFVALFGGVIALGPIGLFAGPMALSASLSLLDHYRERLGESQTASAASEA
jgi:predicted PurR-regulated permease PerM